MSILPLSKKPQPDAAEFDAFFPSPLSLKMFTSPTSGLKDAEYPKPYRGPRRILMIGTDERYLPVADGTLFSTGNHPVETLVPLYHLQQAGFDFDVATVSGNPVKFEVWAMPDADKAITGFHATHLGKFQNPRKLSDVVAGLGPDSDYAAVFIPGGHGPLVGLPFSPDVARVLRWALGSDRHVISICHGPAAFLACAAEDGAGAGAGVGGRDAAGAFPFAGYAITAFPDATDRTTPEVGYMPGQLTWHFGERLKALGVTILNTAPDDSTHKDRRLITGASPLAANALGKLAAETLLEELARG